MNVILKNKLIRYYQNISEIDFPQFNSFLFTVILKGFLKTENMLPVVVGILVVYLGVDITIENYVFFPQSNITAYLTFIVLQIAIGLTILLVVPFSIIILFNYVCSMIQHLKPKLLLPFKFIALVVTFTLIIDRLIAHTLHMNDKYLIIFIWVGLYFFLINTYIAHKQHKHPLKFSKGKSFFSIVFILMIVHPLSSIFGTTLQKINYIQINPLVNIPTSVCDLLIKRPNQHVAPENRTINNNKYFEVTNQGCNLYGNIIRIGFSSDFTINIRDNMEPVQESGYNYNYYSRINCYSGTCFVETNVRHRVDRDINVDLFKDAIYKD